ncbi:hypothetical protein ACQP2X_45645 [Actinoplanes sp. CA-131856]
MTNWMTAAGIALIAGGIATLICFRSVLFRVGGRRAGRRAVREATRTAVLEAEAQGHRGRGSRRRGRPAAPEDEERGGLAMIGLAADEDPETPETHPRRRRRRQSLPPYADERAQAQEDAFAVPEAPLDLDGELASERALDPESDPEWQPDPGRKRTLGLQRDPRRKREPRRDREPGPDREGEPENFGLDREPGPGFELDGESGPGFELDGESGPGFELDGEPDREFALDEEPRRRDLDRELSSEAEPAAAVEEPAPTPMSAGRLGHRVEGWVRPEYRQTRDELPSGEYWTPIPVELDADHEPSAKGYGWPVAVERLPPVPDYEPATGFDLTPVHEPTEVVPTWPPGDDGERPGRIRLPRSWQSRNDKRRAAREHPPAREWRPENEAPPAERRPRPRPRPRPAEAPPPPSHPSRVYVSRHAADPPQ